MQSNLRPKILLIDDESASIALLMAYLKERNYEILVALGGMDGLRKALAGQPDLILLDIRMSDLDGLATCRKLKAEANTALIPVIFLSASKDLQFKLEGFQAGAVDFIEKPFHKEEVLARVGVHLQARAQQNPNHIAPTDAVVQSIVSREDEVFDTTVSFIRSHLADALSVSCLAAMIGTNKEKLTSIFRQRLGMTVPEYITELRLQTANTYLGNSELQIQEIAALVRYRNAGDFTRAYKRRFTLTPKEYRTLKLVDSPTSFPENLP